jgi:hypothetical protein
LLTKDTLASGGGTSHDFCAEQSYRSERVAYNHHSLPWKAVKMRKNRIMAPTFKFQKKMQDKLFSRWASCAMAHLGVLAFWGGMLMAARLYPAGYDWRYMPVSHLLTPGRNPNGHLWATGGVVLCSLCGLCWAVVLAQRGNHVGAGDRPSGISALLLGYCCLICSAVLPEWMLRVHKGHEIFAVLAFAGLCVGMIGLMFQTIERILLDQIRRSTGRARLYAAILASAAVLPILLAGLAQAYVHYLLPKLPWAKLSPEYLSFAFWEWVTCVVLSAYMAILSIVTRSVYRS